MAAAIQVHDIVRVTPKPIEGKVVGTATAGMDDVMVSIRIDGVEYAADAYDFELVNRPEPPKPAAKVGDKLTDAVLEPPVGSVATTTLSSGSFIIRKRTSDGWQLIHGAGWLDTVMPWRELAEQIKTYSLIHLPGE